jgi:hypothetical protein
MHTVHKKPVHVAKLNGSEVKVREGSYLVATPLKAGVQINSAYDLSFLEKSVFPESVKWRVLSERQLKALKKKPELLGSGAFVQKFGAFIQTTSTIKVGDVIDALSELERDTPIAVCSYGDHPREVDWVRVFSRGDERFLVFEVNRRAGVITQDETDFDEDLPEGYAKTTLASVWDKS